MNYFHKQINNRKYNFKMIFFPEFKDFQLFFQSNFHCNFNLFVYLPDLSLSIYL